MINGKLRTVFIIPPNTSFNFLFGLSPFESVITKVIAIINPIIVANIVATAVMYKVWKNASIKISFANSKKLVFI